MNNPMPTTTPSIPASAVYEVLFTTTRACRNVKGQLEWYDLGAPDLDRILTCADPEPAVALDQIRQHFAKFRRDWTPVHAIQVAPTKPTNPADMLKLSTKTADLHALLQDRLINQPAGCL